jgi:hypothetical protein
VCSGRCAGTFLCPGSISQSLENRLLGLIAKLQFGNPVTGTLRIPAHTADRLARVAGNRWPEAGPFPEEKRGAHARRLLAEWAIVTSLAALFFTVVPLAVAPTASAIASASRKLFFCPLL